MANNGTFEINVKGKTVEIELGGFFNETNAQDFLAEYKRVVPVNASSYELVLNCKAMVVVQVTLVPLLEQCFVMYKNSGFVNVRAQVSSNNTVLKAQLTRLSKANGLNLEIEVI